MKKYLQFWRTFLILLAIFTLCLIPAKDIAKIDFLKISYEDLVVHLGMFFTFSAILYRDLKKNTRLESNGKVLNVTVMLAGFLLGFITELLQFLFYSLHRAANPVDLLFDLLGTACGIFFMRFIGQRFGRVL